MENAPPKLVQQIVARQIPPSCDYVYGNVHEMGWAKSPSTWTATCKNCKGEWEIRDGKATCSKDPINPWPVGA